MTTYINGLATGGSKPQESFIVAKWVATTTNGKITTFSQAYQNTAGRWDTTNSKFVSTTTGECWQFFYNAGSGNSVTWSVDIYLNGAAIVLPGITGGFSLSNGGTRFSPIVLNFVAGDYIEFFAPSATVVTVPSITVYGIRVA
jgi:hypothetical protein